MSAITLPKVTGPQFDAILAGLRLLGQAVAGGKLDATIAESLTNYYEHDGLAQPGIDALRRVLVGTLTDAERAA